MTKLKRFFGILALVAVTSAAQCKGETSIHDEMNRAVEACEEAEGIATVTHNSATGVWTVNCDLGD